MKKTIYTTVALAISCILLSTSCSLHKQFNFDPEEVQSIEIHHGGTSKQLDTNLKNNFLSDLNQASKEGPYKFMKTHSVLIHFNNGSTDTLRTNGTIFQDNGWGKSPVDLLKKYDLKEIN